MWSEVNFDAIKTDSQKSVGPVAPVSSEMGDGCSEDMHSNGLAQALCPNRVSE